MLRLKFQCTDAHGNMCGMEMSALPLLSVHRQELTSLLPDLTSTTVFMSRVRHMPYASIRDPSEVVMTPVIITL